MIIQVWTDLHPTSEAGFSRRTSFTIPLCPPLFGLIPAVIYFIFSFLRIINLDLFTYAGAIAVYPPVARAHCLIFGSIWNLLHIWILPDISTRM
jgi:hypothetical protein